MTYERNGAPMWEVINVFRILAGTSHGKKALARLRR
jgi:hypothetical protein